MSWCVLGLYLAKKKKKKRIFSNAADFSNMQDTESDIIAIWCQLFHYCQWMESISADKGDNGGCTSGMTFPIGKDHLTIYDFWWFFDDIWWLFDDFSAPLAWYFGKDHLSIDDFLSFFYDFFLWFFLMIFLQLWHDISNCQRSSQHWWLLVIFFMTFNDFFRIFLWFFCPGNDMSNWQRSSEHFIYKKY